MDEEQIRATQAEAAKALFNAIRMDMYPHQQRLKPEDIRFIEPKQHTS